MILDIYAFRNKKLKCYANPYYSQEKRENVEQNVARSLFTGGEQLVAKYKATALYYLGTFDDETGKFDLLDSPELVLDCDDVIASIPEA